MWHPNSPFGACMEIGQYVQMIFLTFLISMYVNMQQSAYPTTSVKPLDATVY